MWSIRDNRHACVFTAGRCIAGDVLSMKLNMMLTASRWNSSSDYMTRSNHVRNALYRNDRYYSLKAVEELNNILKMLRNY